MKIKETDILDLDPSKVNETKVGLANKIIDRIHPLFDDVLADKISEITLMKSQLEKKKEEVMDDKRLLEGSIAAYNRKKKVKQLLDRVSKLVSSGLINEGTMKNETIVLLKIVDKLPEDKLTFHLNETMKVVTKRF